MKQIIDFGTSGIWNFWSVVIAFNLIISVIIVGITEIVYALLPKRKPNDN